MEEKLKLPNVTLAAMSSVKIYETVKALEYSMQGIEFGEVALITHKKPFGLSKKITYKHTSKLTDIDCFNYKIVYELADYIDTDYVLLVHADGFVIHPESWRDEFLDYDYIGSPWPLPKNIYAYRDGQGIKHYLILGGDPETFSYAEFLYDESKNPAWVGGYFTSGKVGETINPVWLENAKAKLGIPWP